MSALAQRLDEVGVADLVDELAALPNLLREALLGQSEARQRKEAAIASVKVLERGHRLAAIEAGKNEAQREALFEEYAAGDDTVREARLASLEADRGLVQAQIEVEVVTQRIALARSTARLIEAVLLCAHER